MIVVSLIFTLVSFFLMIVLLLSINKDTIQLNSLLHSDYDYSLIMQDTVLKDDYYQFNAGIDFALSDDAQTSLNADVIMQSVDSEYTDLIYWNTDVISENDIAISQNIAKANKLNIGDKLYSKHIVNGEICEYNIKQILPETTNVRVTKNSSRNDGIIIMGYDRKYVENISHYCIVFTNDSINHLSETGYAENIVYREDEIASSIKNIIPYIILTVLISITLSVLFVIILTKYVSCNLRRLIILGFEKKKLNNAYFGLLFRFGIISIFISSALSSIIFEVTGISIIKLLLVMSVSFLELVSLFVASIISNKQLWRK